MPKTTTHHATKPISHRAPVRRVQATPRARTRAATAADLRDRPLEEQPAKKKPVDYGGKLTEKADGANKELTSRSHRIRTLDQLLAHAEVDLREWKVARFVANKWEMGAKHPETGEILVEPLFQVKAWLEPRGRERQVELAVDDLIADMQRHAPKYQRFVYPKIDRKKTDGHLCVYAIPDLHIGKLCHKDETGSNYDSKIAARLFMAAVDELAQRTRGFKLDRILFVVGNDFFNVDNQARTTTGGTPQDEDGRWQKTFTAGRRLLVEAIDKLSSLSPVDVIVIPGNHDEERAFYAGDVLAAWYRQNPQVTVRNEPAKRKYYEYGRVLIGLTHGDKEKMKDLPLIMATEQAQAWARTECREFHLGHRHMRQQTEIGSIDEFRGVKVRRLSSLTAPDAWHFGQGYGAARAAEAFVYHPQDGCVGTFAYNLTAAREAALVQ